MSSNVPAPQSQGAFTRQIEAARAGDVAVRNVLLLQCRGYIEFMANMTVVEDDRRWRQWQQDLTQETWARALHFFPGFRGTTHGQLLAWLRSILVSRHAELLAERARNPLSLADADEPADMQTPSWFAMQHEEVTALAQVLAKLAPDARAAFEARYGERLSWAQIGARLQLTADAVRMLCRRSTDEVCDYIEATV